MAKGEDMAVRSAASGSVDLEVIEDDVGFSAEAEVQERVRGEHADCIEHIRVTFTIGQHEEILRLHRSWPRASAVG